MSKDFVVALKGLRAHRRGCGLHVHLQEAGRFDNEALAQHGAEGI